MTLFDNLPEPPTEAEKKVAGMANAADANLRPLDWLREAMKKRWRELYRTGSRDYVTADDGRVLLEIGIATGAIDRPRNNQWMGSLFAGKEWEFTGHRIKSETPGSHANELKCWRYVG